MVRQAQPDLCCFIQTVSSGLRRKESVLTAFRLKAIISDGMGMRSFIKFVHLAFFGQNNR